jgi:hypothetical protein
MEFTNPQCIRRFKNQNTLPRFSVQTPSRTNVPPFRIAYNDAKRVQSVVLGGCVLFLIGGILLVVGTLGAGVPLFVLSGVFFGLGLATLLAGFHKGRVFPTNDL